MVGHFRFLHMLAIFSFVSLLSMDNNEDHFQEYDFHKKLCFEELINKDSQAYYKKIGPFKSNPQGGVDYWVCTAVSVSDKHIYPDMAGVYTDGDISFKIDLLNNGNFSQPLPISVMHNQQEKNVCCKKIEEKKIPIMPIFDSIKDLKVALSQNKLSWIHKVTLKGLLCVPGEKSRVILVELKNYCKQPITLQGMEVVYDDKTTQIFFDFVDQERKSVDFFESIKSDHSSHIISDQKVVCIKENRMYDCAGKKIYGLFDSPLTRTEWIEDEENFFDLNRKKMVSLPSCYGDLDDKEQLKNSIVWVFEKEIPSFYQLDGIEKLEDSNEYFYYKGGSFFLTLPYQASYKEYFSQKNKVTLRYLAQVYDPSYSIQKNVGIEGGRRDWKDGVYERAYVAGMSVWKRLDAVTKNLIEFDSKDVPLDMTFSTYPLDVQKTKNWCDAAQRFFKYFSANIHFCNQDILNNLPKWDKINALCLSHLKLDNGLKWSDLFKTVGSMKQLTVLDFSHNHPIDDLFSDNYKPLADKATDYYCDLFSFLNNLKYLKKLCLQGLWLKSQRYLGRGSTTLPSSEVARITSLINHKQQKGIKDFLKSVCAMHSLEDLALDGIPNNGNSRFCRLTYVERVVFVPYSIVLLDVMDGRFQDAALKQLVTTSANQLANIPSLKTISVYAPQGPYKDYLSKDFIAQLSAARNAVLPALKVVPQDLG